MRDGGELGGKGKGGDGVVEVLELVGFGGLRRVEWGCYDANVHGRKSHFWKIPPPMVECGNRAAWRW